MTPTLPAVGDVFTVKYPFVRDTYAEAQTWKPGTRLEDWGAGEVLGLADAMGTMTLTVISVHKPGRFPTRVFFTRKFLSPDANEFGKGKLHISTVEKFMRLTRGYFHEFAMAKQPNGMSVERTSR